MIEFHADGASSAAFTSLILSLTLRLVAKLDSLHFGTEAKSLISISTFPFFRPSFLPPRSLLRVLVIVRVG